ncbi:MAG TPA: amino acid permease, partial [Cyanobacteria bacterium UBA8530]|nr:amino acid permease [Cyanobacteria bacterium UBA8530]
MTSAFPGLLPFRVELALVSLFLLTLINLRGVRESASIFALPTYVFIFSMLAMIGIGLWRMFMGLPPVEAVASLPSAVIAPTSVFLILRAFASGCSAMTGTEAMADGVAAFKEPQAKNAVVTLLWMAVILSTLFLGMA